MHLEDVPQPPVEPPEPSRLHPQCKACGTNDDLWECGICQRVFCADCMPGHLAERHLGDVLAELCDPLEESDDG